MHMCVCECVCVCVQLLSHVQFFAAPQTSPPGSSAHGILQARILKWVVNSFSRGSSDLGIEPASLASPALASGFITTHTT